MTIKEAVYAMAKMGGFNGRKNDGNPIEVALITKQAHFPIPSIACQYNSKSCSRN
jgi:hypothetical protein